MYLTNRKMTIGNYCNKFEVRICHKIFGSLIYFNYISWQIFHQNMIERKCIQATDLTTRYWSKITSNWAINQAWKIIQFSAAKTWLIYPGKKDNYLASKINTSYLWNKSKLHTNKVHVMIWRINYTVRTAMNLELQLVPQHIHAITSSMYRSGGYWTNKFKCKVTHTCYYFGQKIAATKILDPLHKAQRTRSFKSY